MADSRYNQQRIDGLRPRSKNYSVRDANLKVGKSPPVLICQKLGYDSYIRR